jgi:hypothetical protein
MDASQNPVVRSLQLLTTGWGYNFYSQKNAARADDLLIREKAAHRLGEAVAALAALEIAYRQAFIPQATRERPYPPADAMDRLRALGRLKTRVSEMAVRIRSVSAPTQDKIWFRIRSEQALLSQLLTYDESLVAATNRASEMARLLTAAAWNTDPSGSATQFDEPLQELDATLRERTDLLLMPTF